MMFPDEGGHGRVHVQPQVHGPPAQDQDVAPRHQGLAGREGRNQGHGRRGPQARGGGINRAGHEGAQDHDAPEPGDGGLDAAHEALQARSQGDQEPHREPDLARVPGARQGQPGGVQVPGIENAFDPCFTRVLHGSCTGVAF
ncbi:hypothetical protein T484DRAFT_2661410 [Baffinella frigidus]|nr:hypothetical protein T484DRAFT_2661410 [Cryptophyta sp. CCMP2293]